MFEKKKLNREIRESKEMIAQLEDKRNRSQAALVEALLNKVVPPKEDVEHFQRYTGMIDLERERLRKLMRQLEEAG